MRRLECSFFTGVNCFCNIQTNGKVTFQCHCLRLCPRVCSAVLVDAIKIKALVCFLGSLTLKLLEVVMQVRPIK